MTRTITRSYDFDVRDVREALIAWLRSKDMQAPKYVGNTDDTKWTVGTDGSQRVEWTEQDKVD